VFGTVTDFEHLVLSPIVLASGLAQTDTVVSWGHKARYPFSFDGRGRQADLMVDNKYNAVWVEVYRNVFEYGRHKSAIYAHPEFRKGLGELGKGVMGEIPPCTVLVLFCNDELDRGVSVRAKNTRKEIEMIWGDLAFILPEIPTREQSVMIAENLRTLAYPYGEQ
jgi:hypothetical protein